MRCPTRQAGRPRRGRGRLEAALGVLDDVGLDAITVRRLAERIGV
ncbi:MAG TPA: hypothetical protein VFX16_29930 [Pseudonocardiaceae bacterium]|nr:hypothetical protein [Pseudonocardiaceae bacterium]